MIINYNLIFSFLIDCIGKLRCIERHCQEKSLQSLFNNHFLQQKKDTDNNKVVEMDNMADQMHNLKDQILFHRGKKGKKGQMEHPRGIDAPEKFQIFQERFQERSQGTSQGMFPGRSPGRFPGRSPERSPGKSQGRRNRKCKSSRQCNNGQYCDTQVGRCFEEKNVTFKGACERNGGKFLLFPIIKIHSKTEFL